MLCQHKLLHWCYTEGTLPVSFDSVALGYLGWKVVFLSLTRNICSVQLKSWNVDCSSTNLERIGPQCAAVETITTTTHTQPHFWLHWQFYSRAFPPLGSMKRKSEAKAKAAAPWCLLFLSLNQSRKILSDFLFDLRFRYFGSLAYS